jgi:hypothetical protein
MGADAPKERKDIHVLSVRKCKYRFSSIFKNRSLKNLA